MQTYPRKKYKSNFHNINNNKQTNMFKTNIFKTVENKRRNHSIGLNPKHQSLFKQEKPIALMELQIYKIQFSQQIQQWSVQISKNTKFKCFEMDQCRPLGISPFDSTKSPIIKQVTFFASLTKPPKKTMQFSASSLQDQIRNEYFYINHNVIFFLKQKDQQIHLRPQIVDKAPYGRITQETKINIYKENSQQFKIIDDSSIIKNLFQNYESNVRDLKVGGLRKQLQMIERRVFGARMLHPKLIKLNGIKNIRGILLFGPPGTGKTLIARQISKVFKVQPKIIHGPQVLSQWSGQSQQRIRNLFEDAIKDQKQRGSKSELHCIIFDQIDALCKKRGSQQANPVHDLVVNQLLTCIDGMATLNNILLIGTTNRKDLIDDAILRPGRLQVHIQVNIPDQQGRLEILNIHTEFMRNNNSFDNSVNLKQIAKLTTNFTGAELQGVVRSTQSFAIEKWRNANVLTIQQCKISQQEFKMGINQIKPQFGSDNFTFQQILPQKNKKVSLQKHQKIKQDISKIIKELQKGKKPILIIGDAGVGKTVLAVQIAVQHGVSFTKIIKCDRFLGLNEGQIINNLIEIFEDADKCSNSLIILDDILRLIGFVPLRQRYNQNILNLIINLLNKANDPSRKQIILATVTNVKQFDDLGIRRYFKHSFTVEKINPVQIRLALREIKFGQNSIQAILRKNPNKRLTIDQLMDLANIEKEKNFNNWSSEAGRPQIK